MCVALNKMYIYFNAVLLGIRNKQRADDSVPNDDVLKMFY